MKEMKLEKNQFGKVETATIQAENDDVLNEYIRGKREIDWQPKRIRKFHTK